MGNYHRKTWYDDAHEVSPFDQKTIAPDFSSSWRGMNHVEKCFFWWYVCYREIIEYTEIFPETPKLFLSFDAFFNDERKCNEMVKFLNIDSQKFLNSLVHERNSRHRFMRETFPLHSEWKSLLNHEKINDFAEKNFNYTITYKELQEIARRYYLPEGLMPLLRHKTRFWERRRRVGHQIKRLFQPQI